MYVKNNVSAVYVYSLALIEAHAEESVCFEGLSPLKLSEADSQNLKVMQYYWLDFE